jgi:hypothetical protein
MAVDLSSEIWNELKRYINRVDRAEAAEVLVSVLVDNDCNPDDIKTAFKGDSDVKVALASYINTQEEEFDEEEEEEEEDYEDWEE